MAVQPQAGIASPQGNGSAAKEVSGGGKGVGGAHSAGCGFVLYMDRIT